MPTPLPTPTALQQSMRCWPAWAKQALDAILSPTATVLDLIRADPAAVLWKAGLTPDPWQATLLHADPTHTLLLCGRQMGKSTTAAALALRQAFLHPDSLILLLSPTLRQSGELFRDKVLRLFHALPPTVPLLRETALSLELRNGSRIVSLPESEAGIRGFSGVSLLVIDEASRVDDALYRAVRPMLAVSRGKLLALSTPFGKRGWFYSAWEGGGMAWERVRVTADQCPRITPEFLAEERQAMGERWFQQEYFCDFVSTDDAAFDHDSVRRALAAPGAEPPLF